MDLDELKQILDLVREHELAEFEIEHDGVKLRLRKHAAGQWRGAGAAGAADAVSRRRRAAPRPRAGRRGGAAPVLDRRPTRTSSWRSSSRRSSARSTARPSPAPRRSSRSAQTVKKGQVLCIIEAMKLMNEIDSEYDGEVVNVYVENGQPVQYGERLFAIRTNVARADACSRKS